MPYVFAYGTLKRGECRESCWPIRPLSICPAWVFGTLYSTGPYPALCNGTDRVLGELWEFDDISVEQVLRVLDVVECTNQPGEMNEYDRIDVTAYRFDATTVQTQIYRFAHDCEQMGYERIKANYLLAGDHYAVWGNQLRNLEVRPVTRWTNLEAGFDDSSK